MPTLPRADSDSDTQVQSPVFLSVVYCSDPEDFRKMTTLQPVALECVWNETGNNVESL